MTRLTAAEHGAAGAGLRRRAIARCRRRSTRRSRARAIDVRYGVARRRGRRHAGVRRRRRSASGDATRSARGSPRSPTAPAPRSRASRAQRHDYGQVALIAKVWRDAPHGGLAYERFTPRRAARAAARKAITTASSGRPRPSARRATAGARRRGVPRASSRGISAAHAGLPARGRPAQRFRWRSSSRRPTVGARCVVVGNAAQTLHPVAGQGFNLGLRDAARARAVVHRRAARRDRRSPRCSPATRARRRTDRWRGHRVHARPRQLFGNELPFAALAARVGAHSARRAAAGEARVHARDDVRAALNGRPRVSRATVTPLSSLAMRRIRCGRHAAMRIARTIARARRGTV